MKNASILIFHSIPDDDYDGIWDTPTASAFERLVAWLTRFHRCDTLASILKEDSRGAAKLGRVAITFDDGYADNHDVVLPILEKYGARGTFFVASGYLSGGWMFNDGIAEAAARSAQPQLDLEDLELGCHPLESLQQRRACAAELIMRVKYLPQPQRQELATEILHRAGVQPPDRLMMEPAQVKALHDAGMEIGGHTVNHPILAMTNAGEARREIHDNKSYLEELLGAPLQSFAYPNGKPGRDYRAEHVDLVREAGYAQAVSTQWGRAGPTSPRFELPRFTPWDRSPLKFMLRMRFPPTDPGGSETS